MTFNRHELTSILAPAAVLGLAWIASAGFTLITGARTRAVFLVSEGYGAMQTDTIGTVWNTAAGFIGFSLFGMFVVGIYLGSPLRTYVGAGYTRRGTYERLAIIGLAATALATAMAGLFWGLSALVEIPEIQGVTPLALLSVPLGQLVAYSLGVFVASLFVRFRWWKVVLVLIAIQLAGAGGLTLVNHFAQPFAIDLSLAATLGVLVLVAAAAWAMLWPIVRELPMRRS